MNLQNKKSYLNKTAYIEVKFLYEKVLKDTAPKMIINLLDNSAYTFYAKLSEDEKIALNIRDKNENIVYTDTIENFIYFEYNFEKLTN